MRFLSRLGWQPRQAAGKRPKTASARRRLSRIWLRRTLPIVLTAALAAGGGYAWQSGLMVRLAVDAESAFVGYSAAAGLVVREVLVEGRAETGRAALRDAIGVSLGDPLLGFAPEAAQRRIETLPWVRLATVERRLSGSVRVRVVEHVPMALWQHKHRIRVIDTHGEVIPDASINRFAQLPMFVGEDAPRHAAELLAFLTAEPALFGRVLSSIRVGGRRWNVALDNGVTVRLPEQGADKAWALLADMERRHKVLARDVLTIDLRLPDRFVVQMTPDAAARAKDPGENT